MFLRKALYVFTLLLLTLSARAQQWPFELWHDGKAVLESGDTLKGQIKYDLQQDLIQYKTSQSTAEAYSARKVLYFEIFDQTVRKYRQFFSLPYAATSGYKAPVFFELLQEGKMTLLTREVLEYRTYSSPYSYGSYSRLVLVNNYFLMKENGDIESYNGKKKSDLLDLMGKHADKVDKFIKANNLKVDEKDDLSRIVEYYNSI